ncbi:MAG: hypothetical protein AAF329_06800 [Cyanobacteria bacterium P01_A01_bin.17]
MPSSIEQRLTRLQQQKDDIDRKIKSLQAEKSSELRKRQEKREKLVGKAVYALIRSGTWPDEKLIQIMEEYLVRASDRKLFALQATNKKTTASDKEPKGKMAAMEKKRNRTKEPASTQSKTARSEAVTKPDPAQNNPQISTEQDDLMNEFNL